MASVQYVRWLGAYAGRDNSLVASARWEMSSHGKEVALEATVSRRYTNVPAPIGLVADPKASTFVRGYEFDAYSDYMSECASRLRCSNRFETKLDKPRAWRSRRRFEHFLVSRRRERHTRRGQRSWCEFKHTEVFMASPKYVAVAVRADTDSHTLRKAERLAEKLGLPLHQFRPQDDRRMH